VAAVGVLRGPAEKDQSRCAAAPLLLRITWRAGEFIARLRHENDRGMGGTIEGAASPWVRKQLLTFWAFFVSLNGMNHSH
jgi:hypothetical protein